MNKDRSPALPIFYFLRPFFRNEIPCYSLPAIKIDIQNQELAARSAATLILYWEWSKRDTSLLLRVMLTNLISMNFFSQSIANNS